MENKPFEKVSKLIKMKKKRWNKKAEILIENVVFILLNVLFLFILILFLLKQGNGTIVLEQAYAKEISLLVDAAQPDMQILMDMEKAMKTAKDNGVDFSEVVKITGNVVEVKLDPKSGYTYSFFNDVSLHASPEQLNGEYTGMYILNILRK